MFRSDLLAYNWFCLIIMLTISIKIYFKLIYITWGPKLLTVTLSDKEEEVILYFRESSQCIWTNMLHLGSEQKVYFGGEYNSKL